jgi:hypothetical protein
MWKKLKILNAPVDVPMWVVLVLAFSGLLKSIDLIQTTAKLIAQMIVGS